MADTSPHPEEARSAVSKDEGGPRIFQQPANHGYLPRITSLRRWLVGTKLLERGLHKRHVQRFFNCHVAFNQFDLAEYVEIRLQARRIKRAIGIDRALYERAMHGSVLDEGIFRQDRHNFIAARAGTDDSLNGKRPKLCAENLQAALES